MGIYVKRWSTPMTTMKQPLWGLLRPYPLTCNSPKRLLSNRNLHLHLLKSQTLSFKPPTYVCSRATLERPNLHPELNRRLTLNWTNLICNQFSSGRPVYSHPRHTGHAKDSDVLQADWFPRTIRCLAHIVQLGVTSFLDALNASNIETNWGDGSVVMPARAILPSPRTLGAFLDVFPLWKGERTISLARKKLPNSGTRDSGTASLASIIKSKSLCAISQEPSLEADTEDDERTVSLAAWGRSELAWVP